MVWTDGRFSTITDIYGARVTAAGAVLEQGGFVIDAAASHQLTPSVAYGGGNYFVAFQDNSGADQNIRAVRVTSGGALVPGSSVLISGAAGAQLGTDLVYGPQLDRFFVTWVDYRSGSLGQAYGQLVSGAGALVGGNLYLQGNGFPSVAWNAATQQFLAVWASGTSVWGALVSGSGLVPGGLLALSDPTGTGTKSSARVASNGADYFIAWDDRRNAATTGADLYGIRVAADGTRVSDVELVRPAGPSSQGDPWLGWEGSRYFLAWTDGRAGSSDVMANWLTSDGARVLSDDLALSFGVNQQRAAAATWDGTNYFVAWVDERNGGQDLYGVRLSPSGVALDPAGIAIATGPTNPSAPAVTWTGSHHLVVWSEARDGGLADLWAQRIAPDGGLEGPNFAVVSAPGEQLPPAIAAGPTSALVVWSDTRDGGQNLYGLRLAHDGGPLDGTGVPLAVAANVQHQPAVAWGTRTGSWCGKTSAPTPSVTSTARG